MTALSAALYAEAPWQRRSFIEFNLTMDSSMKRQQARVFESCWRLSGRNNGVLKTKNRLRDLLVLRLFHSCFTARWSSVAPQLVGSHSVLESISTMLITRWRFQRSWIGVH